MAERAPQGGVQRDQGIRMNLWRLSSGGFVVALFPFAFLIFDSLTVMSLRSSRGEQWLTQASNALPSRWILLG